MGPRAQQSGADVADPAWLSDTVLTDRQKAWQATMDGHADAETADRVVRAHRTSHATIAPHAALLREEREGREAEEMSPSATRSSGSGDRRVEEQPDPVRTCFERDRDRILHGTAFRRLAGKTQVFIFPGDHQRTRLTHALEVAQVARSIAQACRLNVALTEAIAIGHDCGHGPGGHASEDALSPFLEEGYDHAVWGADVVLAPLNLCAQTIDGIRNHSWSRPAPSTPEGEVVSWADRIAYVCHDFEDAVHAGLVTPDDLPEAVRAECGTTRSSQLNAFIVGMVEAIATTGVIGMTPRKAAALAEFRKWNYERIYLRPESRDQGETVVRMLRSLVGFYAEDPTTMPPEWVAASGLATDPVRAAVAYVGGMTDRYACAEAVARLGWDRTKLPRGIGVGA